MTEPDLTTMSNEDLIGEFAGACVEGSDIGTASSNDVMYMAQREAARLEAELRRRLAAIAPTEPGAAAQWNPSALGDQDILDELEIAIRGEWWDRASELRAELAFRLRQTRQVATIAFQAVRYAKLEATVARNQYERSSQRWRFWNGVVQAMSAAIDATWRHGAFRGTAKLRDEGRLKPLIAPDFPAPERPAEGDTETDSPTEPGRVVMGERLRYIIAHRLDIEYDDGELASDVVAYRIMQDIIAAERAASGGA